MLNTLSFSPIKNNFIICTSLTSVTNLATTPQQISSDVFYNVPTYKSTLNVPFESKTLYAAAEVWQKFSTIIEIDPAALTDIIPDNQQFTNIYTIDGRPATSVTPSINIIRGDNNRSKKVIIKN